MSKNVETIRETLRERLENAEYSMREVEPEWPGDYHPDSPIGRLHQAIDALAALEEQFTRQCADHANQVAEIERLRANALDLQSVPEGWHFTQLTRINDRFECFIMSFRGRFLISEDGEIYGLGPTPAAALRAAIERVTK